MSGFIVISKDCGRKFQTECIIVHISHKNISGENDSSDVSCSLLLLTKSKAISVPEVFGHFEMLLVIDCFCCALCFFMIEFISFSSAKLSALFDGKTSSSPMDQMNFKISKLDQVKLKLEEHVDKLHFSLNYANISPLPGS